MTKFAVDAAVVFHAACAWHSHGQQIETNVVPCLLVFELSLPATGALLASLLKTPTRGQQFGCKSLRVRLVGYCCRCACGFLVAALVVAAVVAKNMAVALLLLLVSTGVAGAVAGTC